MVRPGRSTKGVTTMKSYAKSTAVAIALSAIAICSNAYAAGGAPSARPGQMPGGMQNKAAMMMMLKQISSSFGGQGASFLSGNVNPADFLSQLGR
jgi:hypothetical protein